MSRHDREYSDHALWYKVQDPSLLYSKWINAKDYYKALTKGKELTILKYEFYESNMTTPYDFSFSSYGGGNFGTWKSDKKKKKDKKSDKHHKPQRITTQGHDDFEGDDGYGDVFW